MASATKPPHRLGPCFACKQEGHWSRDCPTKNIPRPKPKPDSRDSSGLPELLCPCGGGVCNLKVSGSEANPGRKYFVCPFNFKREGNGICKFFKWHDDVFAKLRCIPPVDGGGSSHPFCPCEAGWCLCLTVESGPNAGRKYFACPGGVVMLNHEFQLFYGFYFLVDQNCPIHSFFKV